MSHEVESMAYVGQVPWHGLGVQIEEVPTVEEMLIVAGLDWDVELQPIFTDFSNGGKRKVSGFFALTRESDGRVFDIVGSRYKPVQNAEAFEFFTEFVEAGDATMETAGSLKDGKYVWGLANLHADFTLSGNDKLESYVLVGKPHEQGKSLIIRRTDIRVVCHNTLTAALKNRSAAEFRMPHRKEFGAAEITQARELLDLAREGSYQFGKDAQALVEMEMSVTEALKILVPIMSPKTTKDQLKKMLKDPGEYTPRIKTIMDGYYNAPGATPGNAWGALNAVTYYADHVASRTQDQRLSNAWFGKTARQKTTVMNELLQLTA